jgi:hypothetical protein
MRDFLPEIFGQRLQGVAGVLDRVVQQCRDQRGGVHPEIGEDRRHGQRMGDVRIAGFTELPAVLRLSGVVGTLQDGDVGFRIAVTVQGHKWFQNRPNGALGRSHTSRQSGPHPAGSRCRDRTGGTLAGLAHHLW